MSTVLGEGREQHASPTPSRTRRPRGRSPWFVLRRTFMEFTRDDGVDTAAALAFFGLLSIAPAVFALLAFVSGAGQAGALAELVDQITVRVLEPDSAAAVRELLDEARRFEGALLSVGLGLLGLLWTASIYVNGFGRALNRVYEVEEGRPFWRLRPLQVGVTFVMLLTLASGVVMVLVTGPVAQVVGDVLGIGDDLVAVWDVAKWPVLGLLLILLVAMLMHLTPNVRFERFRLITPGSFLALLVVVLASGGLAFYVARLGSFSIYGALSGSVVLGLWLWLANLALLFGAELDAELERGRQLRAGTAAEARLVLPTRTDAVAVKKRQRDERDQARMRELRERADPGSDDPGAPR